MGEPFPIVDHVGGASRCLAAAGPVVYRTVSRDSGQRPNSCGSNPVGTETQRVVYSDTMPLAPSLSRDGRRVAVFRLAMGNSDIWSYDIVRRAWDRLTVHPGDESIRSGHQMVRASSSAPGAGQMDLCSKDLNMIQQAAERAARHERTKVSDGLVARRPRAAVQQHRSRSWSLDIWALPLDGERKPRAVVQTEFNEQHPQLSPDGKWMACPIQQDGSIRGLHPAVSQGRKRRARVDRGRRTGPLESRWQRAFLYRGRRSG